MASAFSITYPNLTIRQTTLLRTAGLSGMLDLILPKSSSTNAPYPPPKSYRITTPRGGGSICEISKHK